MHLFLPASAVGVKRRTSYIFRLIMYAFNACLCRLHETVHSFPAHCTAPCPFQLLTSRNATPILKLCRKQKTTYKKIGVTSMDAHYTDLYVQYCYDTYIKKASKKKCAIQPFQMRLHLRFSRHFLQQHSRWQLQRLQLLFLQLL